jgi:hypothetical protein
MRDRDENVELIRQRGETMANQIAEQMLIAHELDDQSQMDWLHSLIQHLVVIRQAALAIREDTRPRTWQVPSLPDAVAAVTDVESETWRRFGDPRRKLWVCDDGDEVKTEHLLISDYGPVTEVTDDGTA